MEMVASPLEQASKAPAQKITFADYEAFLEKLEKEGRLDAVALANPKSKRAVIEEQWENRHDDMRRDFERNS
jgi:hypothetical protein